MIVGEVTSLPNVVLIQGAKLLLHNQPPETHTHTLKKEGGSGRGMKTKAKSNAKAKNASKQTNKEGEVTFC